jgi:hypothetical protein
VLAEVHFLSTLLGRLPRSHNIVRFPGVSPLYLTQRAASIFFVWGPNV